jgi:acetylxylan esterase
MDARMSSRRHDPRARWTAALRWGVPSLLATAFTLVAAPAPAASLQEVTGWSNNDVPTYISMFIYVPDKLAPDPPVMVAAHYCGGSASAYYSFDSSVVALANQYGFIMIFPQTTNPASSADCWDVGSTKSLTHNGGGDTQAIAEMVQYTITKYSANAGRVYSMGSSSGAMLTEALMGVYPEVFKAGAEMSGVPDGCWSDGWSAASNWGGTCANGNDTMTASAWGNLVRAQYPGYARTRPRLWLWVGTADTTISPNNFAQAILEWTNVLDLSATPTSTSPTNSTRPQQGSGQLWSNSCGDTVLEAWQLQGGGHAPTPTASTASAIVSFFGLDTSGPDPGAGCADAGSSVEAGAGGSDAGTGGKDASTGGIDAGTGGEDASTGSKDATTGGIDASTGGVEGGTTGGGTMDGGTVEGGTSGGTGGNHPDGSTGDAGSGDTTAGGSSDNGANASSGCACDTVGGRPGTGTSAGASLVLVMLGIARRRRRGRVG